MNDPVKEVADRVLRDVAERENGVPGVVAMATDRQKKTSTREPRASASSVEQRR